MTLEEFESSIKTVKKFEKSLERLEETITEIHLEDQDIIEINLLLNNNEVKKSVYIKKESLSRMLELELEKMEKDYSEEIKKLNENGLNIEPKTTPIY